MSDAVTATAWLQIQAVRMYSGKVNGAKVVGMTQSRPDNPKPDVRLVKVRLTLPAGAFDPLTATIDVPLEAVEIPEIVGEVESGE